MTETLVSDTLFNIWFTYRQSRNFITLYKLNCLREGIHSSICWKIANSSAGNLLVWMGVLQAATVWKRQTSELRPVTCYNDCITASSYIMSTTLCFLHKQVLLRNIFDHLAITWTLFTWKHETFMQSILPLANNDTMMNSFRTMPAHTPV